MHLGGDAAAGKGGDVAGLAGNLGGVLVEPGFLLVWRVAMARGAGGRVAVVGIAADMGAGRVLGRGSVAAAGHIMAGGFVAGGAGKVQARGVHVHVQRLLGCGQRAVHVAVLHAIAATAIEVAGAAGVAAALAHLLGNFGEVNGLEDLARAGRVFGVFGDYVAGKTGRLFVVAGGVVADHAVHVFFRLEVEAGVLPAVAHVAAVAGRFVGGHRDAKVVHHVLLAEQLVGIRVFVFPLPVLGAVDLTGRFGVAAQADPGEVGAAVEAALQLLELAVVGGGGELERFGFFLRLGCTDCKGQGHGQVSRRLRQPEPVAQT